MPVHELDTRGETGEVAEEHERLVERGFVGVGAPEAAGPVRVRADTWSYARRES